MKKKLLILTVTCAVAILLSWAVMALAQAHSTEGANAIDGQGQEVTVHMSTDLSCVKLVPERKSRLQNIPKAPRAKTNR